jgi:hypothetical protein
MDQSSLSTGGLLDDQRCDNCSHTGGEHRSVDGGYGACSHDSGNGKRCSCDAFSLEPLLAGEALEEWADRLDGVYQCPQCESDNLEVKISAWENLIQDGDDCSTEITSVEDGSHEWDGNSKMRCSDCGYAGITNDFSIDNEGE